MGFFDLFVKMMQLFLIMGLGYSLVRTQFFTPSVISALNRFVLQITMPCLILSSVYTDHQPESSTVYAILIFSVLFFLIVPAISKVVVPLFGIKKERQDVYRFMFIFANTGFIGYPVMGTLFGQTGIFYMALFNMVFNIVGLSYGMLLITGQSVKDMDLKSISSPAIVCSAAALLLYLLHIPLPGFAVETLEMVGSMTTPLAMIVIGASLYGVSLSMIMEDKELFRFTLFKQIVLPVLVAFLSSLFSMNEIVRAILILAFALPVANMASLLANQYKVHQQLCAKGIFVTTAVSVITLPLVIAIFL